MKVKIYPGCKLFTFDRNTLEFGEIEPEKVNVQIVNGIATYKPKDVSNELIIVQALNIKKAAAKMLTIINKNNGKI